MRGLGDVSQFNLRAIVLKFIRFINHQITWLTLQCFTERVEGRFINFGKTIVLPQSGNSIRMFPNQNS